MCFVLCLCQVISQTLSPTWNQCLQMSPILLSGELQHVQREPPRILIEVYDDDALVLVIHPLHFHCWRRLLIGPTL